MNRIRRNLVIIFMLVVLVSCNSKEEADRFMRDQLAQDIQVLKDTTKSTIRRLDSTYIEVDELDAKINSLMEEAKVTGLAISI